MKINMYNNKIHCVIIHFVGRFQKISRMEHVAERVGQRTDYSHSRTRCCENQFEHQTQGEKII